MRFPWQAVKDHKEAKRQTAQARHEYEWAVQNRTTVNTVVSRLKYHGQQNGIVELIHKVAKGTP